MLKKFRGRIDNIDRKVLELLNQRANIAKSVAEYKKSSNNRNIFRPDRESQIIKNLRSLNKGPLTADHIHNIYREIISSCLSLETNLTVSFLGPEGTYSEIATNKFFGKSIIKNSKIKICGEQNIPIKHCLMSNRKSISSIKKIFAHNQTLSQCEEWLSKNIPDVQCVSADSNAQAAILAKKYKNTACLGNEICSKLYGLNVLARNIHDIHNNTTRFIVIGNTCIDQSNNDKTSFVMSLTNKAGALSKSLEVLARSKISMTKIESIPTKEKNWEYLFLIDISGHVNDKKISNALKKISLNAKYFAHKFWSKYSSIIS